MVKSKSFVSKLWSDVINEIKILFSKKRKKNENEKHKLRLDTSEKRKYNIHEVGELFILSNPEINNNEISGLNQTPRNHTRIEHILKKKNFLLSNGRKLRHLSNNLDSGNIGRCSSSGSINHNHKNNICNNELRTYGGNRNLGLLIARARNSPKGEEESTINKKRQPNLPNKYKDDPLYEALFKEDIESIESLLSSNTSYDGRLLLHIACELVSSSKILYFLIEYGFDVNKTDPQRRTPLHIACSIGNVRSITLLLGNGAKLTSKDLYGNTPLHVLVNTKNTKLIDILDLWNCDLNQKRTDGSTILHEVLSRNDYLSLEELAKYSDKLNVNIKDNNGLTPLLRGIKHNSNATLTMFTIYFKKVSKNITDYSGRNVIHHAILSNNYTFLKVILKTKELTKRLLNEKTLRNKRSSIHLCVTNNNLMMLKFLFKEYGPMIDINSHDERGDSALHLSIKLGYQEISNFLVIQGANIHMLNNKRETPARLSINKKTK